MGNSYFQFKQFRVEQANCAMKVTTDACLFGAWAASQSATRSATHTSDVLKTSDVSRNCLDIGTGTGLLSLMLAQKTVGSLDAIEIDSSAANQANENFASSKWFDRLRVFHTGISKFFSGYMYDVVISNPPFFENELRSPSDQLNLARHDQGLTLNQLIVEVNRLMSEDGSFFVLLPYNRVDEFVNLADVSELYLQRKCLVKQTPSHNYFRGMLMFGRVKTEIIVEEIIIKIGEQYSIEFRELLKDYYLNL